MNDSSISLFNFAIKHSRRSNLPLAFQTIHLSTPEFVQISFELLPSVIPYLKTKQNKTKQKTCLQISLQLLIIPELKSSLLNGHESNLTFAVCCTKCSGVIHFSPNTFKQDYHLTKISRINKSGGRFFCLRVLSIENREIGKQIKSLQRTLTEGDMGGS